MCVWNWYRRWRVTLVIKLVSQTKIKNDIVPLVSFFVSLIKITTVSLVIKSDQTLAIWFVALLSRPSSTRYSQGTKITNRAIDRIRVIRRINRTTHFFSPTSYRELILFHRGKTHESRVHGRGPFSLLIFSHQTSHLVLVYFPLALFFKFFGCHPRWRSCCYLLAWQDARRQIETRSSWFQFHQRAPTRFYPESKLSTRSFPVSIYIYIYLVE